MMLAPEVKTATDSLVANSIAQLDIYAGEMLLGSFQGNPMMFVSQQEGRPTEYVALSEDGSLIGRGSAGGPKSGAELRFSKNVVEQGARITLTGITFMPR